MTRSLAWTLCALNVAVAVAIAVLPIIDPNVAGPDNATHAGPSPGDRPEPHYLPYAVLSAIVLIGYALVGGAAASRRPRNPVGWLFGAGALLWGLGVLSNEVYWHLAFGRTDPPAAADYVAWLGTWVFLPAFVLLLCLVPLLFPTGAPPTPRWRVVAWTAAVAGGVAVVSNALAPGGMDSVFGWVDNPFGVEGLGLRTIAAVSFAAVGVSMLVAIASLVVRYRRARGIERLQLKWVALAGCLLIAFAIGGSVADEWVGTEGAGWIGILVGLLGVAVAVAIALLRYRLYDLDLVINRALVYVVLTLLLGAAWDGSVLVLQRVVLSPSSDLAIAASTLVVAALFLPLRAWIQAMVDRRFNRSRYDAQRTLEAFSARLRDQVNLAAIESDLCAVVRETFHPAHATLELDPGSPSEPVSPGVELPVPLISQGEQIGVLNLGPRLSGQGYSAVDRRLLDALAAQAAPALRVGQLVRQQEAEAVTRQRVEHELEVARLIQRNFLPQELPALPGWEIAAVYRPAREVGGDFYDVIPLPDGRVALVVGDVTDKGVPAALVMSATRSVLRAAAQQLVEPGAVLERVNENLCPDMPANMFVTCLYGVLDTETGRLRFANAGHDPPYVRTPDGVLELRARGMPLGLLPRMAYEEKEATLAPGDGLLLHSDGIVEAHDSRREMFGRPRLKQAVAGAPDGRALIDHVSAQLAAFLGPDAEQEDDITMLALFRSDETVLEDFELASVPGNERKAMQRVLTAVSGVGLSAQRTERLRTAVAEATVNAMEHGNGFQENRPVAIRVLHSDERLRVQVTDLGGERDLPPTAAPDLEAKLAGEQSSRGWGLFLIGEMVDETHLTTDGERRTIELVLDMKGDRDSDD